MLNERVNMLFPRNLLFEKIKEKTIGEIVKYKPDLKEKFDNIVNTYINNEIILEVINSSKNEILELLKKYESFNLKTLIFAIAKFEYISYKIMALDISDEFSKIELRKILKHCVVTAIKIKIKTNSSNETTQYGGFLDNEYLEFASNNLRYSFIKDYLMYGYIKDDDIEKCIMKIKTEEFDNKEIYESLSLTKLNNWYNLEDNEILQLLGVLLNELDKGVYNIINIIQILQVLYNLENLKFDSEYLNSIYEKIKKSINNDVFDKINNEHAELDYYLREIKSNNLNEENSKIIKLIEDKYLKLKTEDMKERVNNFYSEETNWIKLYKNNVEDNRKYFIAQSGYFKYIEINKLLNLVNKSKLVDIYSFRSILLSIYNYYDSKKMYIEDIHNLTDFSNGLKNIMNKSVGKTRILALEKLIESIDEIIKEISE